MIPPYCICVPARNEAERLPVLLEALAAQDVPSPIAVVVALNNTTDRSEQVLMQCAARHADRLALKVVVQDFEDERPNAGAARRVAMDTGAILMADRAEAVLISTDADARPPSDWVRANLEALENGVDMVGGRLVLDDRETISERLRARRAAFDRYWERVRAIEDSIDPVPWDLPPRHGDHTGASLAIRVGWYRRIGGVPEISTGEDRAMVDAAISLGARLAHPETVWTRVSPRLTGRAEFGMADAMRAIDAPDIPEAPRLDAWQARTEWRRDLRQRGLAGEIPMREAALPPMPAAPISRNDTK